MKIKHFTIFLIIAFFLFALPHCIYGSVAENEFFSVDLPDGWTVAEGDETTFFVSPVWQGSKAILGISTFTFNDVNLSSEDALDILIKQMNKIGIITGDPKKGKQGFYAIPILTKPEGFIFTGFKDKSSDTITVLGFHPDLANILRSLNILKERPYLSSMSMIAVSGLDKMLNKNYKK
jgi:hypothetical protein